MLIIQALSKVPALGRGHRQANGLFQYQVISSVVGVSGPLPGCCPRCRQPTSVLKDELKLVMQKGKKKKKIHKLEREIALGFKCLPGIRLTPVPSLAPYTVLNPARSNPSAQSQE